MSFPGLAAYEPEVQATLAGGNSRQEILGTLTSCNYFDMEHVYNHEFRIGRGREWHRIMP